MKMLQEIEPYKFHNEFYHREIKSGDYYAVIKDNHLLVSVKEDKASLPSVDDLGIRKSRFLFCIDDIGIYELLEDVDGLEMWNYRDKKEMVLPWMKFAAVEALRLAGWYKQNVYCGCCGNKMLESEKERALLCPHCHNTVYPRINPVAIVGVVDGDRLLLTRYADHSRANHYALVAGFCEFGETVEQTIQREVKEEVGLNVKNIRYVASQSWPMSQSLIFGFYAELDGDDKVSFTDNELDKAIWQTPDEIEYIEAASITSYLINNFKKLGHKVFEQ